MQVAITDARSRDQQWKEAWPVIRQTLMSGGSVLGHCVAGRHRAAGGQALILSLITDSTFQEPGYSGPPPRVPDLQAYGAGFDRPVDQACEKDGSDGDTPTG